LYATRSRAAASCEQDRAWRHPYGWPRETGRVRLGPVNKHPRSELPERYVRNRPACHRYSEKKRFTDSFGPTYRGPRTHVRTHARTRLCIAVALPAHSHVVIESSEHARSCTRYGTEGSKLRPIQKTHPFCKTLCFLRNAVLCIQSRHRTTMALPRGKGI
jgi:hypothetical protein